MANWKLGKIQYSFLETATSGGTLTLTASSKQYQVLTGTMNHTVRLPNATTMIAGVSFVIVNQSTGSITVNYNDNSSLVNVMAGQAIELLLTNISTSNGIWLTVSTSGSGGGGIASVDPGSLITSNYNVLANDNGRVLNVDTSGGAVEITLPAPTASFNITIKDAVGNAGVNPITISRNGSELIDQEASDMLMSTAYDSISFISDGTDWHRMASFNGVIPALPTGRALFASGNTGSFSNVIQYLTIATLGNAVDFGDLTVARETPAACASSTRALFGGGYTGSPSNVIDYVTIATTGNAVDFGDLTVNNNTAAGVSSMTRGVFGGGYNGGNLNTIDYVTIATLANAVDFGDLTVARNSPGACGSSTRGVFGGGQGGGAENTIDYITIASTGNATDFGDLTVARWYVAACSSSTRGVWGGGNPTSNVIDYVTIASLGNATDFGDLTVARYGLSAATDTIKGIWAGGNNSSDIAQNVIDYVTIASLGNAVDFGDLLATSVYGTGCSNAHGGLI